MWMWIGKQSHHLPKTAQRKERKNMLTPGIPFYFRQEEMHSSRRCLVFCYTSKDFRANQKDPRDGQ